MKKNLMRWFVAVGVVLAVLMAGNAWADGRGKGHGGHGHYKGPKHGHHVHHYAPPPVVHHYVRPHVHHYYAPPPVVVQHRTYYVPAPAPVYVAPAPVYVAPPPPPPGFSFSATINEPGFSLGIAAGN